MSIAQSIEEEEIVTFGMEIRLTGTREEVGIAIGNLAEDAMEQQKWRDVVVDVVSPVEIETTTRKNSWC